ncbi:unnamed protein product [Leptidea sinapis]|uniref:Uncharacterized protein n=1 Tax=Leptidea sinapis TaxID=189913 RepID=A0A5E4PY72_9NEOP|nr:unnamed protein product [Leptidea sinapis]
MSQRSSTILDPNNIMPSQTITPPEKLFFHNLENLRPSLQPVKEVKGPVGQILYTEKAILAVEQNKVLMPPLYNKYVAWGFADHSLRIGNYDNDKAVFVSEGVAHACGEIVCCVVTIWQYWSRRRRLSVKTCLYGHEEAVTCLAASSAYNLVVSGSRDGLVIVWDAESGSFMWSIEYVPVTDEDEDESKSKSIETASQEIEPAIDRDTISTQESEDLQTESLQPVEPNERQAAIKRVEELVKQMSLSQENEGNLVKSGSESSLSDVGETTSAKESSRVHDDKDTCSDNEQDAQEPKDADSCNELQPYDAEGDSDKDYDNEKGKEVDDVTHRSKLQKQGHGGKVSCPEEPLLINFNIVCHSNLKAVPFATYSFRKADYDYAITELDKVDWQTELENCDNTNTLVDKFYKSIQNIIEKTVPKSILLSVEYVKRKGKIRKTI